MSNENSHLREVTPDIESFENAMAREAREQAVAMLEKWIDLAKRGEIVDIMVIGTDTASGNAAWATTGCVSLTRRIAVLEVLKHNAVHEFIEGCESFDNDGDEGA